MIVSLGRQIVRGIGGEIFKCAVESDGTPRFETCPVKNRKSSEGVNSKKTKKRKKKKSCGELEEDTPNSQPGTPPNLTPSSSTENLVNFGNSCSIKLPSVDGGKTNTPGILRLDSSVSTGEQNNDHHNDHRTAANDDKRMLSNGAGNAARDQHHQHQQQKAGVVGRRGGFHNVALQTIMKKSGLLDSPRPLDGSGQQVRPPVQSKTPVIQCIQFLTHNFGCYCCLLRLE
jgi:hypothetical protein